VKYLSRDFFNVKMTDTDMTTNIKICSFNCRFVKSSMAEAQQLCDTHDLVLLQEHWLLPNELQYYFYLIFMLIFLLLVHLLLILAATF